MDAEARLNAAWIAGTTRPKALDLTDEQCASMDAGSTTSYSLAKLWSELIGGRTRILRCFLVDTRCFVLLTPGATMRESRSARGRASGLVDRRLAPRKVRVLERILLGEGQKAVALTMHVAPSTVTLMAGECLRAMGLDCRTSRVPMVLVMAAYAHACAARPSEGRITEAECYGSVVRIFSAPRPDAKLVELLSPAESDVARLLIEGKQHTEIANLRDTSRRTIANQLAAAFHKLRVSGRAELLSRIVCDAELQLGHPRAAVRGLPSAQRVSALDSRARSAESLPAA